MQHNLKRQEWSSVQESETKPPRMHLHGLRNKCINHKGHWSEMEHGKKDLNRGEQRSTYQSTAKGVNVCLGSLCTLIRRPL